MTKREKLIKDKLFIWKETGRWKTGTTQQKGRSRKRERDNHV